MPMSTNIWTRFYTPLAFGICLLTFPFFVSNVGGPLTLAFNFWFISIGNLPMPDWYLQLPPRLIGVFLVSWAIQADFAKFFPSKLNMKVHFDAQGISKALKRFTTKETDDLNLLPPTHWPYQQQQYRKRVAKRLAKTASQNIAAWLSRPAALTDSNVHGSGTTDFKIRRESLLEYNIMACEGDLNIKGEISEAAPNARCDAVHVAGLTA